MTARIQFTFQETSFINKKIKIVENRKRFLRDKLFERDEYGNILELGL